MANVSNLSLRLLQELSELSGQTFNQNQNVIFDVLRLYYNTIEIKIITKRLKKVVSWSR